MNTYCITIALCLIPLSGGSDSGIVGGKMAKPHSRKYMVSLQANGHFCGGFLIRDDFVLTAAHCERPKPVTVVLGAHDISKPEKSQQKIQVEKYFKHPKYRNGGYDFDIMLLKLKQKAKLNEFVQTIDLPKKDKTVKPHTECSVAGWGTMEPTKIISTDVLREGQEKIQFNFECKHIWKDYFSTEHMICTKFNKKEGIMCQGDSGGPLICKNKAQGIAAFTANRCDNTKYPHSYTKISSFLPWIKHVTGGFGNESKPLSSKDYSPHVN